jgi:competence protein ComEA
MENMKKGIYATVIALSTILFATILIAGEPVNINTADKEVLMSVKGIGEKRADAIIEYREQQGPFKSIDQLTDIGGISQTLVETNRETLMVNPSSK